MKRLNAFIVTLCVFFHAYAIAANRPEFSSPGAWSSLETAQVGKMQKSEEEVLDSLTKGEDEERNQCYRKPCLGQDHCCDGFACVDVKGEKAAGMCLPIYGRNNGDSCAKDSDCAPGLLCGETGNPTQPKSCQVEGRELKKKKYNDECSTTSECDVTKGLCCQVQRRHRTAPRKVCYYYLDPKSCIGLTDEQGFEPMHFVPNPFFKARLG